MPDNIDRSTDPNILDENPKIVPVKSPRLTVVCKIYHQIPGEDNEGVRSVFYRWIESEEQAYTRSIKIGKEWVVLDTGWFKDKPVSLLHVANTLKRTPSRRPSEEERLAFESLVLEIGWKEQDKTITPFAEIRVGEDFRIFPLAINRLYIRCRTGQGKYTVFLVPA